MTPNTKGKVCPVVQERCHYLACLTPEACVRKDASDVAPFVRAHTREPSPLGERKRG